MVRAADYRQVVLQVLKRLEGVREGEVRPLIRWGPIGARDSSAPEPDAESLRQRCPTCERGPVPVEHRFEQGQRDPDGSASQRPAKERPPWHGVAAGS